MSIEKRIIVFDVETTGLPLRRNISYKESSNWPRIVQFAFGIYNINGETLEEHNFIINPDGFEIPENSTKIHKITNEIAKSKGIEIKKVLNIFLDKIENINYLVAHNLNFDKSILLSELHRNNISFNWEKYIFKELCTMESTTEYCKLLPYRYNKYKWPKLEELHNKLFNETIDGFHNALVDIQVCKKCLFKLKELNLLKIE